MNKYDLKVGDWVRIDVDKFICGDDEEFRGFYRNKVAKVRNISSISVILDTPSFFKGRYATLGAYCLELAKQPNKQLTFIFTD
jgi:SRSO17 transposase